MPPPPNDNRADAQVLTIGPGWGAVQGTTVEATSESVENYGSSFQSVWFVLRDLPPGPMYFALKDDVVDSYSYIEMAVYLGEPTDVLANNQEVAFNYYYTATGPYSETDQAFFDHPGGTISIAVGSYEGDPQVSFVFGWAHGGLDTTPSHWGDLITSDWATLSPSNQTTSIKAPTSGYVDAFRGKWQHIYDVDPVVFSVNPPKPVDMAEEQKTQWAALHGNEGSSTQPAEPPTTEAYGAITNGGPTVGFLQWNTSNQGFYTNDRRCQYEHYVTPTVIDLQSSIRATRRVMPVGAWGVKFVDSGSSDLYNQVEDLRNLSMPVVWQTNFGNVTDWNVLLKLLGDGDRVPYTGNGVNGARPPIGKWWLEPSGTVRTSWPVHHPGITTLATFPCDVPATLSIPDPLSLARPADPGQGFDKYPRFIPLATVADRTENEYIYPIPEDGTTQQMWSERWVTFGTGTIEHKLPTYRSYLGFDLVVPTGPTIAPPLRQRHRNDGLTTDVRQERGLGSSEQSSLRRGGRVYY